MQVRTLILFILAVGMLLISGCSRLVRSSNWDPDHFTSHREVLPNGLTVIYVEDHSAPVVSYATWFRVGSSYERPGATGIAHLFEHMMFKGTKRYSGKSFFRELESKGAQVNAFTQHDMTVYYEVVAAKHLELVIDMESDRLANLELTQKDLDSERRVVKEERHLRVDSNFSVQQSEVLFKEVFGDHPYSWPVIGYQEDLDRLSLEQCKNFFETFYQPSNAIVTIAGDFETVEAKKLIRKYYGSIQAKPLREVGAQRLLRKAVPRIERSKQIEIRRPVQNESIMVAYIVPEVTHQDMTAISMLSAATFGLASSKAHTRIVRDEELANHIGAELEQLERGSLLIIGAEMRKGVSAEQVLSRVDELISEIKQTPFTDEELGRLQNALLFSTINETRTVAGASTWYASGELFFGDPKAMFSKLREYKKIRAQDLMRTAQRYLDDKHRVVVVMRPST